MLKGGKEVCGGIRFSKNEEVRFAPKESYNTYIPSYDLFAKNGFSIACHGVEGAKKLGEVSVTFPGNRGSPSIYTKNYIQEGEKPIQAIVKLLDRGSYLLLVGNNCFDEDKDGYSFGRLK